MRGAMRGVDVARRTRGAIRRNSGARRGTRGHTSSLRVALARSAWLVNPRARATMDGSVLSKLKSFDAYPKTLDDVRVKTYAGAAGTRAREGNEGAVAGMRMRGRMNPRGRSKTKGGAERRSGGASCLAVTLISSVIIAVLFISEFTLYLDVNTKTELVVDVTRDQKMRINFNITFPRLSCHGEASADVRSASGGTSRD